MGLSPHKSPDYVLIDADHTMKSARGSMDEQRRPLPGDSLIQAPIAVWTRGITIASPRAHVWPWIAQMGADRAGWYSYDFLDNGGRPSATEILPHCQEVCVGHIFPALPGAADAFVVAEVDTGRSIVLTVPGRDDSTLVSWAFLLERQENSATRLLVRARVSAGWRELARESGVGGRILLANRVYQFLGMLPGSLMTLIGGIGHGIMERRMLQGIKRRAESRH